MEGCKLQPQRGRSGEARQSNASVAQEFAARTLVRWPFFLLDHRFMCVLLFLHFFVLPGFFCCRPDFMVPQACGVGRKKGTITTTAKRPIAEPACSRNVRIRSLIRFAVLA
jgi:hypothetical protein